MPRTYAVPMLPAQVRVLAVGLLDPTPARIAGDVEHRRERVAGADGEQLLADHVSHSLDEVDVPRRGEADRLREHRGVPGAVPADRLLVHDHRDAEPGALDDRRWMSFISAALSAGAARSTRRCG